MTNRVVSGRDELRLTIDWLTSVVNTRTRGRRAPALRPTIYARSEQCSWSV